MPLVKPAGAASNVIKPSTGPVPSLKPAAVEKKPMVANTPYIAHTPMVAKNLEAPAKLPTSDVSSSSPAIGTGFAPGSDVTIHRK